MLKLDKATTRRLAVMADVDPRTIEKVLRGESVCGMAGRRALAILVKEKLLPAPRVAGTRNTGGRP